MDDTAPSADAPARPYQEQEEPERRRRKFRFKSEHRRDKRSERRREEPHRTRDPGHHREHRHRRSSTSRTRRGRDKRRRGDASAEDAATSQDAFAPEPTDPETAFRESLFDAMADDEGAAYWEGVYGQPIHTYPRERVAADGTGGGGGGGGGKLEQMTDEEYAAYVRQKMWERTHAGLLEARARRDRDGAEKRQREEQAEAVRAEVERSLRRGETRRIRRTWATRWADYERAWRAWEQRGDAAQDAAAAGLGEGQTAVMPWPLGGLPRREWTEDNMRTLLVHGLDLDGRGEKDFAARLKAERVRWHPDKMQQKLGGMVDPVVMKDITAVFQMIDKIWNEMGQR